MVNTIVVIGAGTMGSGIALTAAQHSFDTTLFDIDTAVLEKAKISIQKNLQFLVDKQKISLQKKADIFNHLKFTSNITECIADVFIEAIVEKLDAKVAIFSQLASINKSDAVFASNTSSLSISNIQTQIIHPERVCGMHFFNPANIMKLVEVVKGSQTSSETIEKIYKLSKTMQKTPVLCNDAPGFIVNRVARHFYLEAMLKASNSNMAIEDIDTLMENAGFKMGPFKLMDLRGLDVNYAVSQSVYSAFDNAIRFTPSPMQAKKVAEGKLGKKTGEGFYNYQQNIGK